MDIIHHKVYIFLNHAYSSVYTLLIMRSCSGYIRNLLKLQYQFSQLVIADRYTNERNALNESAAGYFADVVFVFRYFPLVFSIKQKYSARLPESSRKLSEKVNSYSYPARSAVTLRTLLAKAKEKDFQH